MTAEVRNSRLQFEKTGTGGLTFENLTRRELWNPQSVDHLFAEEQVHYDGTNEAMVTDALWAKGDKGDILR
jgi:hypothetical protein